MAEGNPGRPEIRIGTKIANLFFNKSPKVKYDSVELREIAKSAAQFSHKFLKTVATDNPGNLITSSLSAHVVLGMIAYGAGGKTAAEIRSVLAIPDDDKRGQSGYETLIKILNSVQGVDIRLANKIYVASQFPLKPTYKKLTATKFLSPSEEIDFRNSSAAAITINNWCEKQTNKRIKDMVSREMLGKQTTMLLVNAIYFKGQWAHKFDPLETHDAPFHVDDQITKSVPTMSIINKLVYARLVDINARLVEIPYQGGELSMLIILPNEVTGLNKVLENLHKVDLTQSLQKARSTAVQLYLPKFRIESALALNQTLVKMGMNEMFENWADFSGIADGELLFTQALQKAYIETNEEGTEAAAVCIPVRCTRSGNYSPDRVTFAVDRPFYYEIYHKMAKVSLFAGIVQSPSVV